ncbi:MAG: hypothetical protein U5M51_02080 [Emticicia sp.]|nr:hypothetical protein [Emticicia sp.]
MQETKELMMLSMLENPTATERLKAVSYTQELNKVDDVEKTLNLKLSTEIFISKNRKAIF